MSQPPPDPDRPPSPWEQPASGPEPPPPPPPGYDPNQPPPPGYDPNQPQPPYGAPPSGQPQWGQPPYHPYGPPPGRGTNVLAILSLVFAFVFAPAGIVLGHLAKRQIRTSGEEGDQLATWGLILSYAFTALGVLVCCGWIVLAVTFGSGNMSY